MFRAFSPLPLPRLLGPLLCAALGAAAVSGCTNEPALKNRSTAELRNQSYPDLLPIDDLLTTLPTPQQQSAALEQELKARSARLDRRAEALRRASN